MTEYSFSHIGSIELGRKDDFRWRAKATWLCRGVRLMRHFFAGRMCWNVWGELIILSINVRWAGLMEERSRPHNMTSCLQHCLPPALKVTVSVGAHCLHPALSMPQSSPWSAVAATGEPWFVISLRRMNKFSPEIGLARRHVSPPPPPPTHTPPCPVYGTILNECPDILVQVQIYTRRCYARFFLNLWIIHFSLKILQTPPPQPLSLFFAPPLSSCRMTGTLPASYPGAGNSSQVSMSISRAKCYMGTSHLQCYESKHRTYQGRPSAITSHHSHAVWAAS